MAKGNVTTESERKKQAGELIKNADKFLKAGDPVSAFQANEQALQLDQNNLYALAYRDRIKAALVKAGIPEPEILPVVIAQPVAPVLPVDEPPAIAPPPPPKVVAPAPPKPEAPKTVEKPITAQPKVEKPKAETIMVEPPIVEKPKVEIPKTVAPKVEPPKVEQPVKPAIVEKPKQEIDHLEAETSGKIRKLAAIMFTDMVGYTALSQKRENLAIRLLDTQQKLIRPLLKKYDGKEIKTVGDAFLAEFVSVLHAARCGIEIQKAMYEYNTKAPKEEHLQLRIGIHLGDIVYQDNDIFGDGVNIASRIQTHAQPGGIFVSQDVYNQIRNRDEFIIEYVGEVELKNIISPVPIYKLLTEVEIRRKREEESLNAAIKEGVQEAQKQKIHEFLTKAKELEAKNALQEALVEVTKILQISPQHPEARLVDSQIRNKRIGIIGKQIEDTRKPPHAQMIEWYKEALVYALKEGNLTPEENRILSSWRAEIHLTDQDHETLLKELSKN